MNKEQKIWLLICAISFSISFGLIYFSAVHNIRPRYGFMIIALTYSVAFISLMMWVLTQYASTKEIISILTRKICGGSNDD